MKEKGRQMMVFQEEKDGNGMVPTSPPSLMT